MDKLATIDNLDLSDLLKPEILARLSPEDQAEAVELMERLARAEDGWPRVYVNRDTLRPYKPHTVEEAAFVYMDFPRSCALLGGEGCLAAESLIGEIPIAEYEQPSLVPSAVGLVPATRSYLKGKADLYRLRTASGHEVVATLDHRFLTPTGWRSLRDLASGDLVAACGMLSVERYQERRAYSWDQGSLHPRQCGEQPNPLEWILRQKQRQLCGIGTCFPCMLSPSHSCKRYSFCPLEQTRLHCGSSHHDSSADDEYVRREAQDFWQCLHMSLQQGSVQPAHPLADCISVSRQCMEHGCRTLLAECVLFRFYLLLPLVLQVPCLGCDAMLLERQRGLSFDAVGWGCRVAIESCTHGSENSLTAWQSPWYSHNFGMSRRFSEGLSSVFLSEGISPINSTTSWVACQDITYVRYGDFYDIHIPAWNHYVANGLIHHNSGKSTAGIIKGLNRIRRSMPGVMSSPDLPHFQRSLWKEFQRWCPWDMVIPAHRRMGDLSWLPVKPFDIVFENNTYIHCLGVKNAGSLEGPNINWAHFDEARHYGDRSAIVVLDGRIRIPGPNGEPPQMWFTTTPLMHWLFDFFGPVKATCHDCRASWKGIDGIEIQTGEPLVCKRCGSPNLVVEDDLFHFKRDSRVVRLSTKGNEPNTMDGFAEKRGQSLTAKEGEVLLLGKWGEIEEGQPFLPYILWWDQCQEVLPSLGRDEPLIVSMDAATGRQFNVSDCFALVGITRHPDPTRAEDSVAVRFSHVWQARTGDKIDFRGTKEEPGPERVLLRLCGYELEDDGSMTFHPDIRYHVIIVVVDPTELNDMIQRLTNANIAAFEELGQTHERYEADRQLLNLITQRRIAHDGDPELRMHMMSADRRLDSSGKRMRIVKRTASSRIDLAVAVSMGTYVALKYNL